MLHPSSPRALSLAFSVYLAFFAQQVVAQSADPVAPPPLQTEEVEGIEPLTRGALHEAFADQVSQDLLTGVLAPIAPPEPIDEIPPEIKPEGDDIEWIPGYWYWDVEREDYIWISGVWRKVPPGREWVPGYWTEVDGKFRRVSGMWSGGGEVTELEYLPYPPESLERGPVSPAPSPDYFWESGCWVYHNNGYSWRPGSWRQFRRDWVWMPTRYLWSPNGCLYQSGYWDYPFASRGQLYSPIYFHDHIYRRPQFHYQPSFTISPSSVFLHLFVRTGHSHYYFGNYYGNQHRDHYHPWYDYHQVGRRYDPLITHAHGRSHHAGIDYVKRLRDWNHYFTNHSDHRPPTTIRHQREFEHRHADLAHLNQFVLGRSIKQTLQHGDPHLRSHRTTTAQHEQHLQRLARIRTLTESRRHHEADHRTEQHAAHGRRTDAHDHAGNAGPSNALTSRTGRNVGRALRGDVDSHDIDSDVHAHADRSPVERIGRGAINRIGAGRTPSTAETRHAARRAANAQAAATADTHADTHVDRKRELLQTGPRKPNSQPAADSHEAGHGLETQGRDRHESSNRATLQQDLPGDSDRPNLRPNRSGNTKPNERDRQPKPVTNVPQTVTPTPHNATPAANRTPPTTPSGRDTLRTLLQPLAKPGRATPSSSVQPSDRNRTSPSPTRAKPVTNVPQTVTPAPHKATPAANRRPPTTPPATSSGRDRLRTLLQPLAKPSGATPSPSVRPSDRNRPSPSPRRPKPVSQPKLSVPATATGSSRSAHSTNPAAAQIRSQTRARSQPRPAVAPKTTVPQPRPAAPKPRPTYSQPRPAAPKPQPTISQPHPAAPKPRPTFSQPRPAAPKPQPTISQPRPAAPKPRPTISQPRPAAPKPRPTYSQPRPAAPKPRPTYSQPRPAAPKPRPTISRPQPKPSASNGSAGRTRSGIPFGGLRGGKRDGR